MNPASSDMRFGRIVEALAAPDAHIPAAASAGIDPAELKRALLLFRSAVFAGYFDSEPLGGLLGDLYSILARQSARACAIFRRGEHPDAGRFGERVAGQLLELLPELRRRLGTDVKAVFDGDPAAASYEEVILCYPALVAMTHYRFAHALLQLGVPILPRLISEAAHSATGIDIHPGAEIGEYFSIDHGTGVVIGETCVIGDHVRLYQGVTLGAKSFKFDAAGHILDSGPRADRPRFGHRRQRLADDRSAALFAGRSGACEHLDFRGRRRYLTPPGAGSGGPGAKYFGQAAESENSPSYLPEIAFFRGLCPADQKFEMLPYLNPAQRILPSIRYFSMTRSSSKVRKFTPEPTFRFEVVYIITVPSANAKSI